ncbi:MAG: hypothetical protein AAGK78_08250 [Planctomycetota bacterium]
MLYEPIHVRGEQLRQLGYAAVLLAAFAGFVAAGPGEFHAGLLGIGAASVFWPLVNVLRITSELRRRHLGRNMRAVDS